MPQPQDAAEAGARTPTRNRGYCRIVLAPRSAMSTSGSESLTAVQQVIVPAGDLLESDPAEMHDPASLTGQNKKLAWGQAEDKLISAAVAHFGTQWNRIAALLPNRSEDAVRNRWHRLQKACTESRLIADRNLLEGRALLLSRFSGGGSIPEAEDCAKRSAWTKEEDELVMEGVAKYGLKWRQACDHPFNSHHSSIQSSSPFHTRVPCPV